jgi:hypothetical protein
MSAQAIRRIRACFRELASALDELLEGDEWIDQKTSPLGRRAHCEAARAGRLRAKKIRGRWLAKRADIDEYIEQYGSRAPVERPDVDDATAIAEILAFRASRRGKRKMTNNGATE